MQNQGLGRHSDKMCTKSAIHKDTDLQNLFGQSDQSVKTFGISWKKRPIWVSVVYDRIHRSSDDFSSEPIHSDKICTKSAIINPQNPQKPPKSPTMYSTNLSSRPKNWDMLGISLTGCS